MADDLPRPKKGADAPSLAAHKAKAEVGRAQPPPMALRIALGTAGLLLLVGFFLPWLRVANATEEVTYSGMELVTSNNVAIRQAIGETQRWVLLVIPVIGLALTAIGYLGFRWSGPVSAVAGMLLIGYGIVVVVTIFIQATAAGLWLILLGTFTATGLGMWAWLRMRSGRTKSASDLPPRLGELADDTELSS